MISFKRFVLISLLIAATVSACFSMETLQEPTRRPSLGHMVRILFEDGVLEGDSKDDDLIIASLSSMGSRISELEGQVLRLKRAGMGEPQEAIGQVVKGFRSVGVMTEEKYIEFESVKEPYFLPSLVNSNSKVQEKDLSEKNQRELIKIRKNILQKIFSRHYDFFPRTEKKRNDYTSIDFILNCILDKDVGIVKSGSLSTRGSNIIGNSGNGSFTFQGVEIYLNNSKELYSEPTKIPNCSQGQRFKELFSLGKTLSILSVEELIEYNNKDSSNDYLIKEREQAKYIESLKDRIK